MSDLETRLVEIVRADADLMHVLTTVRGLDLPDWRVFSGAVYQSVWNAVTGRPVGYGRKDFDLGYFDPDTSWDAEDVIIKRVAAAFEEPFRSDVEVRNQARVHLWFHDRFGEDYEPLPDTDDLRTALRHYERLHLNRVLRQWPDKREAAKRLCLGLSSLYRKIEEHGIQL